MFRKALGVTLLAAGLALAGCHTIAWDSTEVAGSDQRLVVGAGTGFFSSKPRIWVYENGECQPVTIQYAEDGE